MSYVGCRMNTFIHTPTPNLSRSLDFYQKLGFKSVTSEVPILVSDGRALIEINPDRFARAGVKLFAESWKDKLADLEKVVSINRVDGGYLLSDPSGVWIYLVEGESPVPFEREESSFSALGNYAGLSLESTDIARSLKIWKTVGFSNISGSMDQGWLSCTNSEQVTISLMKPSTCPHMFFNPSLTYFNAGKNLEVIEKIRDAGISITEEITQFNDDGIVDNVIIQDPGGYGFFVFND